MPKNDDKYVYDDEEYDEEYEEEYNEEYEEGYEDFDGPQDVEEGFRDLGQKAKKYTKMVLGIDENSEQYDGFRDHFVNYTMNHGVLGVITGVVSGVISFTAEMFRVFFHNLMGNPEHLNFQRLMDSYSLNPREKDRRKEFEQQEPKSMEKEQKITERTENQKGRSLRQSEYMYNREAEQKINDEIEKQLNNPESMDQVIDVCINNPIINQMFKDAGVHPVNIDSSSSKICNKETKIHLFSCRKEMDMDRVFCMHKKDFIQGDATMFAAALFNYNSEKDTMQDRLTSVMQALTIQSRIKWAMYSDLLTDLPENNETELATVTFHTTEMDLANISVKVLADSQTGVIEYNGEEIGTFNLTEINDGELEQMVQSAIKEYERDKERVFVVGDIRVERNDRSQLSISLNGKNARFTVKEERDLQKISAFLQKEKNFSKDRANISAMVIGAYALPAMQKSTDLFGYELNPFTNERKKLGDFSIDKIGNIERYQIDLQDGAIIDKSAVIAQMPGYWAGVDLENLVDKLEEESKLKVEYKDLECLITPTAAKGKNDVLKCPSWSNGSIAYDKLKKEQVLSGIDLSAFKFKSKERNQEESKEERKEKLEEKYEEKAQEDYDKGECEEESFEEPFNFEENLRRQGFEKYEPDENFEGFENASFFPSNNDYCL